MTIKTVNRLVPDCVGARTELGKGKSRPGAGGASSHRKDNVDWSKLTRFHPDYPVSSLCPAGLRTLSSTARSAASAHSYIAEALGALRNCASKSLF